MTELEMLELMKQALAPIDKKLDSLDAKVDKLEARMDSLEAKVDKLEARMDGLEARVGTLETQLRDLAAEVSTLSADMSEMKQVVAPIPGQITALTADVNGIKIVLENEFRRDIDLLAEGHAAILGRLPSEEEREALITRVDAIEAVVRLHSKQIQELKKAQ